MDAAKKQDIIDAFKEIDADGNGWISKEQLLELSKPLVKTGYGEYLVEIAQEEI